MSLYTGQRIKHYVIKDQIACGGMGEIWRAWDDMRGEYVVIKAIVDTLFLDTNFTTRFLDEGRRHLKLTHPNIVPVFDVFYANNQNCLVLKFIEGMSLAEKLRSRPDHRLSVSEAVPILQDVLSALNYAHMHGVIHRDVKPSNVLIDRDGKSYLIDFGIALAVGEDRRTRTGQTIGTPHYMSPEQIATPKDIDHRTDVYSVGCVFYEMLTGRPPFIADAETELITEFAIKKAHINNQPIPPQELVPTIPPYINNIILFALQKKPTDRLPGCQEFMRLLSAGDIKQGKKNKQRSFRWIYFFFFLLAILWLVVIVSFFIR